MITTQPAALPAARVVAAENEAFSIMAGDAAEQQQQHQQLQDLSSAAATDSNEDFMKFTEIFNYLSEEEDFEPSSSSSSSPSPTPSTSPLSSTFSLSLSASNSSMSSLRVNKAKLDEQHMLPSQPETTHKQDADEESVCSKKIAGDMDNVSIDSLPLSSALSSSLMSVNTISSSTSTPAHLGSEYSSSLPAASNLASLPSTIASFTPDRTEEPAAATDADQDAKPSGDLASSEAYQKALSTSTPVLSALDSQLSLTKPSPEFVVESVLGLNSSSHGAGSPSLKPKSIWSSALYLPCLHPALFELNSAHSVTCLSGIGDSKQLGARKYGKRAELCEQAVCISVLTD